MAEYVIPDDIAGVTGIAVPEGERVAVRRMARLLGVSASGYYAHVKRCAETELTPRRQRRADLEGPAVTAFVLDCALVLGSGASNAPFPRRVVAVSYFVPE
ncbi:hypothetical protein [Actinokineospora iranica]|uniref:Transposase n=1 Tax=Actinokineospora iranica TaxID=1271860 RepID=A0A1G6JNN7_9PSEU|nr:hypothetical protein [Actinokineospora iranica]SDC20055.1 hypothetical protein SAMN05216174_101482 [Actinokineospora iranica]